MNKNLKKFFRALTSFTQFDYKLIVELDKYANEEIYSEYKKAKDLIEVSNLLKSEWNEDTFVLLSNYFADLTYKNPLDRTLISDVFSKLSELGLFETIKYINESQCFGTYTKLFTVAIINRYTFKNFSLFVTINSSNYRCLETSFKKEESFNRFINKLIEKAKEHHYENPLLTLDEIKIRIDSLPKALVDFLNIEEVRIFGSYARNEQTVNSDYDFLAITNDVNHDDDLTRSLLGKYFEENFGEHFDIVAIDINQKTLNPFEFVVLLNSKEIKRFGVI